MSEAYQPNPVVPPLARVAPRGPASRELRELVERWLAGRRRDRELEDALRKAAGELRRAQAARRDARVAQEEASADGLEAPDAKLLAEAEERVRLAEAAAAEAVDRLQGWREKLKQREQAVHWHADAHRPELAAEVVPALAEAETRFRDALGEMAGAAEALVEVVRELDSLQAVSQGAQRVGPAPVPPGHNGLDALLRDAAFLRAQPLVWLPEELRELAQDAGVVVADPVDRRIVVNDLRTLVSRVVVEDG